MTQLRWSAWGLVMLVVASASFAENTATPPKGITMNVVQEMNLGDLSTITRARQHFLPPQNFRLEGTLQLKSLGINSKMVVVGDGKHIKQLTQTPFGPQASTVDLAKVQQVIPGYSPSSDYDPSAYKKMLDEMPDKTPLPDATLDGNRTKGYEFSATNIPLPLPSNLKLGLPKPDKVRAWINPNDGLVRKLEILDAKGALLIRMQYTDVKTNVVIDPKIFAFKFPNNVKPMDMTQAILGHVKGTP